MALALFHLDEKQTSTMKRFCFATTLADPSLAFQHLVITMSYLEGQVINVGKK